MAGRIINRFDMGDKQLSTGDCVKIKNSLAIVLCAHSNQGLKVQLISGDDFHPWNSRNIQRVCPWQGSTTDLKNKDDIRLTFDAAAKILSDDASLPELDVNSAKPVLESAHKDTEKGTAGVSDDSTAKRKTDFLKIMPMSVKAGVTIQQFDCMGNELFTGDCVDCVNDKDRLAIVLKYHDDYGVKVLLTNGSVGTFAYSRDCKLMCRWKGKGQEIIGSSGLRSTFSTALFMMLDKIISDTFGPQNPSEKDADKYIHSVPDDSSPNHATDFSQGKDKVDPRKIPSLSIPPPVPANPVNLKVGTTLNRFDISQNKLKVGDCVKYGFQFAIVMEAFKDCGLKVVLAGGVVDYLENSKEAGYVCRWQGTGDDIASRAERSFTFEYAMSLMCEHLQKSQELFRNSADKNAIAFETFCSFFKLEHAKSKIEPVKSGTTLVRVDRMGNVLRTGDCVAFRDRLGVVLNSHKSEGVKAIFGDGKIHTLEDSKRCEFMCNWQGANEYVTHSYDLYATFGTAISMMADKVDKKQAVSNQPADKDTENATHNVPEESKLKSFSNALIMICEEEREMTAVPQQLADEDTEDLAHNVLEDPKLKLVVNFLNEMPLTLSQAMASQLHQKLSIRNFTSYDINDELWYQDPALRHKKPEDVQKAMCETLETYLSLFVLDGLPWEAVKKIVYAINESQHNRVRDQLLLKDTDCEM